MSAEERDRALGLLITRYSVSAKHLHAPGPTDDELWTMGMAALRAPDRHKKIPFRFVVARGAGLERLADLFERSARSRGREGAELQAARARAMDAPVTLAVVARIDTHDAEVPAHEQWVCVGAAVGNALMALHFMGYGAKMVSGARAADAQIAAAFCAPGEQLVGWIVCGTPKGPVTPRDEVDAARILAWL